MEADAKTTRGLIGDAESRTTGGLLSGTYTIILKAAIRIFTAGASMRIFTAGASMRIFTKVTDRRSF